MSALNCVLLQEKTHRDQLAKEHKQLQKVCSKLEEDCLRHRQEKQELIACVSSFQDSCTEKIKMLSTMQQTMQDLAIARQDLATSSQAAAENASKAERLQKENASLREELQIKVLLADQDIAAVKTSNEKEMEALQHKLVSEKAQHQLNIKQIQARHELQVQSVPFL